MTRKIYIGPALNRMWFYSEAFGKSLGLDQGDPTLLIKKSKELCNLIIKYFKKNLNSKVVKDRDIEGIVQFGQESIFLYQDEEIMEKIASLSRPTGSDKNVSENGNFDKFSLNPFDSMPIYPIIHHPNDTHPEKKEFLESIEENFERTKFFGGNSIIIHFHTKEKDPAIYQKTLDALTSPKFLDLVEKYKIYMQLENNHHGSYFGFGDNIVRFYKDLDNKLENLGRKDLIPYFSFCFDYGHFITQSHMAGRDVEEEILDFFSKFADRIGTFHLHTNDGTSDQHVIPIKRDHIIIPKGYRRYDDTRIANHNDILWKTLKNWVNLTKGSSKPINFIFEINSPFTREQFARLGLKLSEIF